MFTRKEIQDMKSFDERRKLHRLNKMRSQTALTSLAIFGLNLIGISFKIIPANSITGLVMTLSLLGIIIPILRITESQSRE